MNKELIVVKGKVIEQEKGYHANVGKHVGYELGAKMIKRHWDENPDDVVATFIGRNHIETILAQPGCVGIRSFYALNEVGMRQLVLVGVDQNGRNMLEVDVIDADGKLTKKPGSISTNFRNCPPYCGEASDMDEPITNWF